MLLKGRFIVALKSLEVSGDMGRGDKINDTLYITNNKNFIKNLLSPEKIQLIGILEAGFIRDAAVAIWGDTAFDDTNDPVQAVNELLYDVQGFLQSSWMFKDNSIDTEIGFLFYNLNGLPTASSSYIDIGMKTASGNAVLTTFSREELRLVRSFNRNNLISEKFGPFPTTKVVREASRITRALYMINGARSISDVAIKITYYCTALETLFATSQNELSHQLAERVAHFIEDSGNAKLITYQQVKQIYALRSKITHGSGLRPNDFSNAVKNSITCDEFLRKCLQKIFSDNDIAKKFEIENQLDDFFLRLIFSADEQGKA